MTVTQNGVERELTVEEALQLKTYQAALKGSKMAVRAVLKMIERREEALALRAAKNEPPRSPKPYVMIHDSDSADEAMNILEIASIEEAPAGIGWGHRKLKLETWAAQAALSRPGRKALSDKNLSDAKLLTKQLDKLKLPRRGTR